MFNQTLDTPDALHTDRFNIALVPVRVRREKR